jgi:eukaryotic-like serine/threonine-protein kinase
MSTDSSNDPITPLGYPRITEAQIEDFLKKNSALQIHPTHIDVATHQHTWGATMNTLPSNLVEETIDFSTQSLSKEVDQGHDYCPLIIDGLLGIGGEGFVQLASQTSLNRAVAVKRVINRTRPGLTQRLIAEAKLTGSLEHPNIIPIHALVKTSEGEPLIIMKRVEGHSWETNLSQQGALWPSDRSEQLLENIHIFLQVCRAVEFAHSREILHLDIKPENVMLGEFGEVYLVDWGIAKHIDTIRNLDHGQISGTPHFMSSEMTEDLSLVTIQSDIALLGSTLHRVIMGNTRYQGNTLGEVLMAARSASSIKYPRELHRELGGIINMACHRDPAQRFETVTSLRQAIERYLEHRVSIALVAEGEKHLKKLVKESELHKDNLDSNLWKADERILHQNSFRELALTCRLTFERALESWPENWPAQVGLDHVLIRWAKFEIGHKELHTAESLLQKVMSTPTTLLTEIESQKKLIKLELAEQKRLLEMKHALSFKGTSRYQSLAIILNGLFWACTLMMIGSLNRQGVIQFNQRLNFQWSTYAALFVFLGLVLYWRLFTDTLWRKRFTAAYVVYLVLAYLCRPLAQVLDLTYQQSLCIDGMLLTMFVGQLAAFIHPYMWVATAISLISTLGCIYHPQWTFEYLALAILSGNLCLSSILGDPTKLKFYTHEG